jgi:CheY-like chemotaxis protein
MSPAKTVLVVDDSRVSRLLARQFILARRCFWHVEEAASGEEAIDKIQARLARAPAAAPAFVPAAADCHVGASTALLSVAAPLSALAAAGDTRLPDLILVDVNMPGMGGLAAAARLRTLCPNAHISLLTANVQAAMRRRAAELGIGFLAKPMTEVRIAALLDALA